MANEWVLIYETEPPIPFTVANATGIEKGALLAMTDPMTAILVSADGTEAIAGVAAEEKIASDGKTKIGVYRRGIFRGLAGGAVTVGESVVSNGSTLANEVITAPINGENIVGIALETVADTETFLIELNPIKPNLA